MSQPKEIGTLVVVALKAQHLHQPSFYKQDPYAQASLSGLTKRTKVDPKGGQHPVWDDELRFPVLADVGKDKANRILEVACYKNEQRGEDVLLGKGTVDIEETLKTGEFDDWIPLETSAGARGEIYLEMTFYANAPPPLTRRPSKLSPSDRLARPAAYFKQGQLRTSNLSVPGSSTLPQPGRSPVVRERLLSQPTPTSFPASLQPARGPASQTSKQASPNGEVNSLVAKHSDDSLPPLPVEKDPASRSGIEPGKKSEVPAALLAGGRSGPRPIPPHVGNRVASGGRSHHPELHVDQPHRRTLSDTVVVHSPTPPPFGQAQTPVQAHHSRIGSAITGVGLVPAVIVEDDVEGHTPAFPMPSLPGPVQGYELHGTYEPPQHPGEYDAHYYGPPGQSYTPPDPQPYPPTAQGYQTYSPSPQPTPPQPLPYTHPGQPHQYYDALVPQQLVPSSQSPSQQPQYVQYPVGPPTPQIRSPPQTYPPRPYGSQPQQQQSPQHPSQQPQPYLPQQKPYTPPQQQPYVAPLQQYHPQQPPYTQTPYPPPTPQPYHQSNYSVPPPSGQTLQQHPTLTYPQSPGPPPPFNAALPYSQPPPPSPQPYFGAPPPPPPAQTPQSPTSVPRHQPQSYFSPPPPPPPPPLSYNQGPAGPPNTVPAAQVVQNHIPPAPSQVPVPPSSSLPQTTPVSSAHVAPTAQLQTTKSAPSQALSDSPSPPSAGTEQETEQRELEKGLKETSSAATGMPAGPEVAGSRQEEEETGGKTAEDAEREWKLHLNREKEDEEQRVRAEAERKRREVEERLGQEAELRRQEELKRREEEERRLVERRMKEEEEECRRKEEEERRRKEEEERRVRDEEERRRRVEEERKRREEEERRQREEEERRRRETEERRRREEEERRRQKEEARKRLEEEERRTREEERLRREREEVERRRKAEEVEAERRWQEELARLRARDEQEAADAAFARAQFEAEEVERRRQEEADLALARQTQEEAEQEERLAQERRRQEDADMEVARREQAHEEELEKRRREDRWRQMEEADREMARRLDMELNLGTQRTRPSGDQSRQRVAGDAPTRER